VPDIGHARRPIGQSWGSGDCGARFQLPAPPDGLGWDGWWGLQHKLADSQSQSLEQWGGGLWRGRGLWGMQQSCSSLQDQPLGGHCFSAGGAGCEPGPPKGRQQFFSSNLHGIINVQLLTLRGGKDSPEFVGLTVRRIGLTRPGHHKLEGNDHEKEYASKTCHYSHYWTGLAHNAQLIVIRGRKKPVSLYIFKVKAQNSSIRSENLPRRGIARSLESAGWCYRVLHNNMQVRVSKLVLVVLWHVTFPSSSYSRSAILQWWSITTKIYRSFAPQAAWGSFWVI